MIIDSHLHVWDRTRAKYAWLGPHLPEVDRDISFEEVAPELNKTGVSGVVLVQSADEPGDTENMLEVAAAQPRVLGVVGWVPLESPRDTEAQLERLRANPLIVGIRNLIHDRADPDWVLGPAFDASLGILADSGLPFDFVTSNPSAINRLITVAQRHPDLRIVLDHLGKPPIGGSAPQKSEWIRLIRAVAALPNVYAKVSGLYAATGDAGSWTAVQVAETANTALDAFGAGRLMYGGDWPMSNTAGGYGRVFSALNDAVSEWSGADRTAFFELTATDFYGLKSSRSRR